MGQKDEIGRRIKELRETCGFSQEEIAAELGVDVTTYAAYEDKGVDIPIGAIFVIANKCGVDFTEIVTGKTAKLNSFQVVRAGEGLGVNRFVGYDYKDLAYLYGHKIMQPSLVKLEPGSATLNTHLGQEFNYVVQGSMSLIVEDKMILLNEGDSAYLNAELPHGHRAENNSPCIFIAVIAE